jgi:putative ABC transport system permease protein
MTLDTLILAIREIRRHLLRSFLTILGIIIGVASVIVMVTLGNATTVEVTDQIARLGSNMLMVTPGKRMGPQRASGAPFKLGDAEAIEREITSLNSVAPVTGYGTTAIFGNKNWSTSVSGTTNMIFSARNLTIDNGREFTDRELRSGASVCIIGETIRTELFGEQDGVGKRIRLGKLSFHVIGSLAAKGQNTMGIDQDDVILVPINAMHRRIKGSTEVDMIQVSVADGFSTEEVRLEIEALMRERRNIASNKDDDFQVMDMKEISNMLTGTTKVLTALLSAVAAISLLVGGIGIMNIMLVSVTERTREIGIRLAIGALEREVLTQFLVESVVLSSSGGIIGIVVGLLSCISLKDVLGVPFIFYPDIVIIAFLFSAAVGVVFGYFPAMKAASLNPIEALRHE